MIDLEPPYRRAGAKDAMAIAELVNIAGEGLPLYLWTGMTESGQSPWDIGQQRAMRDSGSFSYLNTVLRDDESAVAAALIGYPLPDTPEPINYEGLPAMFVPLQELEALVPGTWYVNVLATYPEYRGRGYGSDLLSIAERLAIESGKSALSIIVSDANCGARRLYERSGYAELATRPIVKESWEHSGDNWVLLERKL